MATSSFCRIPYEPPAWASKLKKIPSSRVKLAHADTPIHEWKVPGVKAPFTLHVKRDDLTGSTLTGNKVRKLEFLLADALDKGCKHIITCGGIQSNHCRATAVASAQMGLKSHLVLRSKLKNSEDVPCNGNLLLDRMCGAQIYIVPWEGTYESHLKPSMENIARGIKETSGEDSYLIPVGGSNSVGLFGYITVFHEMISQGILDNFDDIAFACGSGATAAGLAVGNYLNGSKLKIHALIVCEDAKFYNAAINEMLDDVGLTDVRSEDMVDMIEGPENQGYGVSTQEELDYFIQVGIDTGVIVDPTYTGKAVKFLVQEMNNHPDRFKGRRVLFLHTGGIYGLFDGRMDNVLKQHEMTNRVKILYD
ncbi:bifunctional D-cysteine desulfhydrase/1-aminocyclopropane-1-carboxylate deaminase, mitochondrial-like [Lingula anatina]|uniref:Bifunctional D-cysteine desulfhydrase/1-aminocyclopropane-1-carboxylate deaminase, mitochondrial-like n=1 Tax=Lingula anatina TaxID=7574 RepID=A0A1S3HTW5_LINAN|nr:bifunctional D-cysteine desulfhydrase/1-aminocyclopropane-1-carboxylate deaminase, mitochondrial-like [Lingula anatina]XP_023933551.1 bifunctional D-cysteine desulfhydrase/1-aminocyclopropane-1-carboxylate deaminase, mitochondrial-like [Lingula anatina]|eukprot:XP_013388986.1 bifunctional D-cysteine desulfhydrase/1-aminocyclopropane-1-carboxylate deaminase, mitochondrial-like [Lingula anatina]